jgi:hypothetical protein
MLPVSLNPAAKLSCEALRLGCEAYSLIGLRLFKMATGAAPALWCGPRLFAHQSAARTIRGAHLL